MGRRGRRDDDFDDTLERSFARSKKSKVEDGTSSVTEHAEQGADVQEQATTVDASLTEAVDNISKIEKLRLKKQGRKDRKKAKTQERKDQEDIRAKERSDSKTAVPSQPHYDMVICRKGVTFQDIMLGKGPFIQDRQKVHVKYTLRKENARGKIIDSSNDFGFRLGKGEVIVGWDIGLDGMRQGGKRQLFIPPEAGYGMKDIGAGKGGILFFEVSLLSC
jgi:FKBP-type peptidyl-prolyl cis-trans isomerase